MYELFWFLVGSLITFLATKIYYIHFSRYAEFLKEEKDNLYKDYKQGEFSDHNVRWEYSKDGNSIRFMQIYCPECKEYVELLEFCPKCSNHFNKDTIKDQIKDKIKRRFFKRINISHSWIL